MTLACYMLLWIDSGLSWRINLGSNACIICRPGEYLNAFKVQAPYKVLWQGAMRRTSMFASKQAALDTYKRKAFKDFDPKVLQDIVEHGFASLEGSPPYPFSHVQAEICLKVEGMFAFSWHFYHLKL